MASKIVKNQIDASYNMKNAINYGSDATSPKVEDDNQSEGEIGTKNFNIEEEYDQTMKLPVKQHILKLEVRIFTLRVQICIFF